MRFRDLSGALRIVGGMTLGVFLWANFAPQGEPEYRDVIVEKKVIETVEKVDTLVTWKERIVYVTRKAETVATAPDGAREDVLRFCAESRTPPTAEVGDSAKVELSPVLLLRSVRFEDGWFFGKDRVVLTGPLSNSDLRQLTYRTRGSFRAVTHQDSLIVQYPRTALLKQVIEYGSVGLGFFLLGRAF